MRKRHKQPGKNGDVYKRLRPTGHCLNCGADLRYVPVRGTRSHKFYCCRECQMAKPPGMALFEQETGDRFVDVAWEHLRRGGSLTALADKCGVHQKGVIPRWLKRVGFRRVVRWERRDGTA